MRFINPKTDFAFKKIFGSEQSHEILISFLNAMLYDGNDTIRALEILEPCSAPRIRGFQKTCLAAKATTNDNATVTIKAQILNDEGFEKDLLYNAAYSKPMEGDEEFTDLKPAIALTITEFNMFPELNQLISRFNPKDKIYLTDYPIYEIELVFVELPKFQKQLAELETLTDKWLYFLKTAKKLEVVPPVMDAVPAIQKAFAIANRTNLSTQELDDLEHQEIFIQDRRNAIETAVRQGIEQGESKAKLAIARQLLAVLDDAAIGRSTGLSLEEIAKLRNEN